MSTIEIHLPAVEAEQSIEIEVKVNGKKRKYHYRVELFSWEECEETEHRASCLRRMVEDYDKNWQLVHIGSDTIKHIPLMFKQRN